MLASILFKLKRKLRLSELLLCKILLACKMPLCGNKVTLLSALMSTESQSSEVLPSRNLLIALEPIGLSKFCGSIVLLIFMAIERYVNQNCLFSRLWRRLISNYLLFCHSRCMFTDTHAKFEDKSLASFSVIKR